MRFKFTHGDKTAGTRSAQRTPFINLSLIIGNEEYNLSPEQNAALSEFKDALESDDRNVLFTLHHSAALGVQTRLGLRYGTDPVRCLDVEPLEDFHIEGFVKDLEWFDWSAVSIHVARPSWRVIWVLAKRKEAE